MVISDYRPTEHPPPAGDNDNMSVAVVGPQSAVAWLPPLPPLDLLEGQCQAGLHCRRLGGR